MTSKAVIWTRDLRSAADRLACDPNSSAEVRSRATDLTTVALGSDLFPFQLDFIHSMRSRFNSRPTSAQAQFETAWAAAYDRSVQS